MDLFHLNIFPLKELLVSVIEEIIFLGSDFFFLLLISEELTTFTT